MLRFLFEIQSFFQKIPRVSFSKNSLREDFELKFLKAMDLKAYDICKHIIQNKEIDLTLKDESGRNVLLISAFKGRAFACSIICSAYEYDEKETDSEGNNCLLLALQSGNMDSIQFFLNRSSDFNVTNKSGYSPLTYGILRGQWKLCDYLTSNGANVEKALKPLKSRF